MDQLYFYIVAENMNHLKCFSACEFATNNNLVIAHAYQDPVLTNYLHMWVIGSANNVTKLREYIHDQNNGQYCHARISDQQEMERMVYQ
jgi:hypothetical protein